MNTDAWKAKIRAYIEERFGGREAEFARFAGIKPTMLVDIFRRTKHPRIDTIARISRAMGMSISELYEGGDTPTTVLSTKLKVGAGDMLSDTRPSVVRLDFMADDLVSVRVVGDDFYPAYRDGDVICGQKQEFTDNLSGTDCIVELLTGERYVKRVMRGTAAGKCTLRSIKVRPDDDMLNVRIKWAAPIRLIARDANGT